MANRTSTKGRKLNTPERISQLRHEIISLMPEGSKNLPAGAAFRLAEKYGISEQAIFWHKRQAMTKGTAVRGVDASRPGGVATPQPKRIDARTVNREALNADIAAGKSEDELIEKYGLTEDQITTARERVEEKNKPPMTIEECKKVVAILDRLAEKKPEVFSRLGIVERLGRNIGDILLDLI